MFLSFFKQLLAHLLITKFAPQKIRKKMWSCKSV